jgi:energy-coupling factor transporter ATP-binding protein EcfA2
MQSSVRASKRGLEIVDQARRLKGWSRTRTLVWWEAAHTSQATLRRFWRGLAIQADAFISICQAVGISNWETIADTTAQSLNPTSLDQSIPGQSDAQTTALRNDWNEAPDVSGFYGRTAELTELETWIRQDCCKLVALVGLSGIGKTSLAVVLADILQTEFDLVVWRSLRSATTLASFLESTIPLLSSGQTSQPDQPLQIGISQFIHQLQQRRCLLVLDELETIFRSSQGKFRPEVGYYREGYEEYGELLQRIANDRHQSCVLITSREKPAEVAAAEGKTLPVRSLQLRGLETEAAKALFQAKGFTGEERGLGEIIQLYGGNPLALKVTSTLVQEIFNGEIAQFLSQKTLVVGDRLRTLLRQQLDRLSELEKEMVYWLAIEREPVVLAQFQSLMLVPPSSSILVEALAALDRRSLLEKVIEPDAVRFTLQPLVIKCVVDELIEHAIDEIADVLETKDINHFKVLKQHWLAHSSPSNQSNHHVNQPIIKRLVTQFQTTFRMEADITNQLRKILSLLQEKPSSQIGYANRNLEDLLNNL